MRLTRTVFGSVLTLFALLVAGCDSGMVSVESQEVQSSRLEYPSSFEIQNDETVVIDFEDAPVGELSTFYIGQGVAFAEASVISGFGNSGSQSVNGTDDGPIELSFVEEVIKVSASVSGNCPATLTCYDATGTLVGSQTAQGSCNGLLPYEPLEVSGASITRCEFADLTQGPSSPTGVTILFDDLSFTLAEDPGEVLIDVKPGSSTNPINLGASGKLPVAILTTDGFDATTVNVRSVEILDANGAGVGVNEKRNGSLQANLTDVDGDGDQDLLMHFEQAKLEELGAIGTHTVELVLTGETNDGTQFTGSDTVTIIPPS